MTIEAVGAISTAALDAPRMQSINPTPTGADFATMLGDGMSKADASLKEADSQLRALAAGQDVAIHDVIISMEHARMNLTMAAEVRNRIVDAYQEMMRMQL
ncbi:MAG: flagellar hook-basal body complex protein FliE [Pseudomonadota bacterium]|nr:flagellar hook-basal body complex protein FliE [Pseudomonadota bacterium]